MKQVKFKQVGMQNYCLFIDPMELNFKENKTILITGPNGVGKSSIFDCLPFTLYGMTSKGAHGDDVTNDVIGKDCHTWLTFSVDNILYRVDRYHKHKKFGNTVILNRNGEDIKRGQREVVPEIERILVPQKLFMNTLLFGQKVKNFFTDLVDSEKKEIFRKILQLDDYVLFYKETDRRLKIIAQEVLKVTNNLEVKKQLLNDAKFQIKILTQAKNEFEKEKVKQVLEFETTLKQLQTERNSISEELDIKRKLDLSLTYIDQEINNVKQEISSIDTNLRAFYQEIQSGRQLKESELRSEATKAETEINSKFQQLKDEVVAKYRTEVDKIKRIITKYNIETNKMKEETKSIQFQRKFILNEITNLKENIIDKDVATCPTCQQTISPETLQKLKDKMEHNQQKDDVLRKEITNRNNTITGFSIEISNLNIKMEDFSEANSKHLQDLSFNKELELKEVQNKIDNLLDQLETRATKQLDESTTSSINQKKILETKKQDLEQKKSEREQNSLRVQKLEDFIVQTDSHIKVIEDRIEKEKEKQYDETQLKIYKGKVQTLNDDVEILKKMELNYQAENNILEFWKIGFSSSGIPSLLIDDSIPFMNQQVSTYMEQISHGRYIVSFDTLKATKDGEFRDKIAVNVVDNKTKANSRIKLSGGQTRLVDIATILTLCDLQNSVQDVKFNIIMFDEIFDSLDDENIEYVSQLLRKLVVDKSVLIISHKYIDKIEADEELSFY